MALKALLLKPLHCDDHSRTGLWSRQGILIDPPLKDVTKPALAHEAVGAEVPRCTLQLTEREGLQIRGRQDFTFWSRSREAHITKSWYGEAWWSWAMASFTGAFGDCWCWRDSRKPRNVQEVISRSDNGKVSIWDKQLRIKFSRQTRPSKFAAKLAALLARILYESLAELHQNSIAFNSISPNKKERFLKFEGYSSYRAWKERNRVNIRWSFSSKPSSRIYRNFKSSMQISAPEREQEHFSFTPKRAGLSSNITGNCWFELTGSSVSVHPCRRIYAVAHLDCASKSKPPRIGYPLFLVVIQRESRTSHGWAWNWARRNFHWEWRSRERSRGRRRGRVGSPSKRVDAKEA